MRHPGSDLTEGLTLPLEREAAPGPSPRESHQMFALSHTRAYPLFRIQKGLRGAPWLCHYWHQGGQRTGDRIEL